MSLETRKRLTSHPLVVGIAIGACAAGDEWEGGERAKRRELAHCHLRGTRRGWICIRRWRHYNALTLRHEIAHLIRENDRHDEAWRNEVVALGGKVEASYRKRKRS